MGLYFSGGALLQRYPVLTDRLVVISTILMSASTVPMPWSNSVWMLGLFIGGQGVSDGVMNLG